MSENFRTDHTAVEGKIQETVASAISSETPASSKEKSKPRLIFAWNYLRWGGSQIYILSLIKAVIEAFDVYIVLPEGSDPQLLSFFDRFNVQKLFFKPASDFGPAQTLRRRSLRRILKIRSENAMLRAIASVADRNSIVHVDLAPQQSFRSLIQLCRKYEVFVTAHNSAPRHSPLREFYWTLVLRFISRFRSFHIFTANRETKAYLCRYLSEKYHHRIIVTPAAIDPEEIENVLANCPDRRDLLKRHGLPTDKSVILTVGQFVDRKGRWILLEAARQVIERHQHCVFVWVMPELPNGEDRARISNHGLGESFRPIRSSDVGTDRTSVLKFFTVANIFALPSVVEGLPIAILEAMALGIPTVSTRINAIPEAIIDGQTGILVDPANAGELADAIVSLVRDDGLRGRLSEAGRRFVIDNFNERLTGEIALNAYKMAISVDTDRAASYRGQFEV